MSTTERYKAQASSLLDLAMKVGFPILLGVSTWAGTSLIDLDARVRVIEATRYTQQQARVDRDKLADSLSDLKTTLASVNQQLADMYRRMSRIEDSLKGK